MRHPIGDWPEDIPFLLIMEKELLQMRASVLQCQSTALRAACPRMAAGSAVWVQPGAQGCGAEQGPCCAPHRGCVPGQGLCRLPGSALSLPGELPRALRGDVWGEGAPRQGRDLLLPELLPGAEGSLLHCIPECFQEHFARGETRQGFSIYWS